MDSQNTELFSCLSLKLPKGDNVNNCFYAEIDCLEFQTISIKELVDVSEVFKKTVLVTKNVFNIYINTLRSLT